MPRQLGHDLSYAQRAARPAAPAARPLIAQRRRKMPMPTPQLRWITTTRPPLLMRLRLARRWAPRLISMGRRRRRTPAPTPTRPQTWCQRPWRCWSVLCRPSLPWLPPWLPPPPPLLAMALLPPPQARTSTWSLTSATVPRAWTEVCGRCCWGVERGFWGWSGKCARSRRPSASCRGA